MVPQEVAAETVLLGHSNVLERAVVLWSGGEIRIDSGILAPRPKADNTREAAKTAARSRRSNGSTS